MFKINCVGAEALISALAAMKACIVVPVVIKED
jgi:hypothetical protein